MNTDFTEDDKIRQISEAYSLDAVDAAKNFGHILDFSEQSIAKVELILGELHSTLVSAKPSAETIWSFAKAFGSYVGEVFRKHHGGQWGMVKMGDERFPGIQTPCRILCWPWGRVHQRLTEGPENNVLHYYQHLVGKLRAS